jgi:hypothetical protein
MAAPHRFNVVEFLAGYLNPNLSDGQAGADFTRKVAATLHFGSSLNPFPPDSNWGLRRNPSGAISNDVINYRATGETIDICVGMGGPSPRLGWNPSTPGEWIQPDPADVVGGSGQTPGPTPTPDPGDTAAIRADVRAIREILEQAAARFL